MKTILIAAGGLVGLAAWAGLQSSQVEGDSEDVSVLDPVTDILDTWNMSNAQALQMANVQAFLGLIRKGEGTADDGGYCRLVGGGRFSSYADHPRKLVYIERIGASSTAAGAYQILSRTWNIVKVQAGLSDFSPESQDIAAVQLIRNRGALQPLLNGDLAAALAKCSYEWASLPPWRYNKQGTLTTEKAYAYFSDFGGSINV